MASVGIVQGGLFNVMYSVPFATPTFLRNWLRPSATGAQNLTQIKLIIIKLFSYTWQSSVPLECTHSPAIQGNRRVRTTYVMPILNKPVVFQPHKSFSVNVFLIYAECVPKVWKLMKNKYISVISVITDLNLAYPTFPPKRWKTNNIFLHSWKKVHRNLSERTLQFVDKSSLVYFRLFISLISPST